MDFNKFEERLKKHNSHLKLMNKTVSEQEEIKVYYSNIKAIKFLADKYCSASNLIAGGTI